jgi:hypothetical protein
VRLWINSEPLAVKKQTTLPYHHAGKAGIQYAAAARRNKSSLNAGSFDSVIASGFERTGQGFPPLPSSQAVGALGLPVGNLSMPLAVLVERRRS